MEFLVIAYAALAFAFCTVLLGRLGLKMDLKERRIERASGEIKNAAFLELNKSLYERLIVPRMKALQKLIEKSMPEKKDTKRTQKREAIARQLRLAGMFIEVSRFEFIKNMVMAASIVVALIIIVIVSPQIMITLLILAVAAVVGLMGPTMYLNSRATSHQEGIRKQLPDAMDMLGVCIEAGLSFDASLLKIAEKLKGPFIDELMIVHREIQMGRTRRDALKTLCDASDIEELKTFTSALIQAEQLGIPINNVMKVQSEQLRIARSQQAKEKGMKASIKMLVPMLLFIFPVVFIIVLGPTVLTIIDTL